MAVTETKLKGVFLIEPQVFGDSRGWFMETWSKAKLEAAGLNLDFVQDNQSYSATKGTLRGLHYQLNPMAQAKLVRCTRGSLLDVAVDIRKNSPQYAQWVSVILSAENKKQLLIPRGFAHGFLTLTDDGNLKEIFAGTIRKLKLIGLSSRQFWLTKTETHRLWRRELSAMN